VTLRWKELTEEEKERQRRERKRRKYLTDIGRSPEVPAGPTMEHVRRLHDEAGMSFRDISRATGTEDPVHASAIADLYRGQRAGVRSNEKVKRVRRGTAERLLAVPVPERPMEGACAYVPVCGVRRRLQALACAGFGAMTIATFMNRDHKQVWRDMTGRRQRKGDGVQKITAANRELYAEAYTKLINTDPAHIGATAIAIGRAKAMAERRLWVPSHCWDEDTIDNPEAIPEWTGLCGTLNGRYIHGREGIPMCDACRAATQRAPGVDDYTFDAERLARRMEVKGMTRDELAALAGCSKGSVDRWLDGTRQPTHQMLDNMSRALGVTPEELCE
jgi:hypothetical protein